MEQLARAWDDCASNKRSTASARAFYEHVEQRLYSLRERLIDQTYRPGKSICFVVTHPKPREVWASDRSEFFFKEQTMQKSLPTFGEPVPGEGGRLVAIMRGAFANGERQPDYALILADPPKGDLGQMAWGTYGTLVTNADSLTDGFANTLAMAAAGSPLARKLQKLTIDGHKDWYLASRAEYWAARGNTPEFFAKEWHWTSTQDSALGAFVQDFQVGSSGWDVKGHTHRVRAFRRIPLFHFNA